MRFGATLGAAVVALVVAALVVVGCSASTSTTGSAPASTVTIADTVTADTTSITEGSVGAGTPAVSTAAVPSTATRDSETPDSGSEGAGSSVEPEGFTTATVEVIDADGETCEVCVWLADSAEERSVGLMGVTDLGGPAGMAFVWDQPTNGAFYMFQTVTPLSIAWFGLDGALVSMTDMDPCLETDASKCDTFPAGDQFVLAIEVFQGDLGTIGISDGSMARLVPGSESDGCPLAPSIDSSSM